MLVYVCVCLTLYKSTGTMIAAPLLLLWARRRPLREVVACMLLLMTLGNVGYSQAYCVKGTVNKVALLLVSRVIVGVSAALHTVSAAYLSQISTMKPTERSVVIVYNDIHHVLESWLKMS